MKTDTRTLPVPKCSANLDHDDARIISGQNDKFRRELLRPDKTIPGHVSWSRRVRERSDDFKTAVKLAVAAYTFPTAFDDPYSERDVGTIEVVGVPLVWQIDVADPELPEWMTDRTDLSRMVRLLSIMPVDEY